MHFPPPLFQPKKVPIANNSSYSSCGCHITTNIKDLGKGGRGSEGEPRPPCHQRPRNQLIAHPLFPQLRLQGLRVRSTTGTVRDYAKESLEVGVQGTCPLHFSSMDMSSRAIVLTISKQGPQPRRTVVPLLELSPEEIASADE